MSEKGASGSWFFKYMYWSSKSCNRIVQWESPQASSIFTWLGSLMFPSLRLLHNNMHSVSFKVDMESYDNVPCVKTNIFLSTRRQITCRTLERSCKENEHILKSGMLNFQIWHYILMIQDRKENQKSHAIKK